MKCCLSSLLVLLWFVCCGFANAFTTKNGVVVHLGSQCLATTCDMACDKGPYIYTDIHVKSHEGLGSSWQRDRLGLILQSATGYEWVRSYYSKFRNVDKMFTVKDAEALLTMMGMCEDVTCNVCSMENAIEAGKMHVITIDTREIHQDDPQKKSMGAIVDDDTLLLCRASGTYANDTGSGLYSPLLPPPFSSDPHSSSSSSSSSSSFSHALPPHDQQASSLVQAIRERRQARATKAHERLAQLSHPSQHQHHHLHHHHNHNPGDPNNKDNGNFDNNGNNVVYKYHGASILENPACSLPLFSSLYTDHLHQEQLSPPRMPTHARLPFHNNGNQRKARVVIHVRWGDVQPKINQTSALNNRIIPLNRICEILEAIMSIFPNNLADIYIIAEATGEEAYFMELKKRAPHLHFIQGGQATILRDLEMMAQADILIASRSSFAVMGASMNGEGILIVEKASSKFDDWEYFRKQSVLNWAQVDKHTLKKAVQHHHSLSQLLLPDR